MPSLLAGTRLEFDRVSEESVRTKLPTVSALIIARDEAANLVACLNSLAWCDERIVVVDAASCDSTEALAREHAEVVIVREFSDFASQRNAGRLAATGDWIFAVDADERSCVAQEHEIRSAISQADCSGFRVPIRSIILGRAFRFSGTQNDWPLRLFKRDCGKWVGEVHETVAIRGMVGAIETALSHRTIENMTTFLSKIDRYTTLEARRLAREGRTAKLSDLTIRPIWTFVKLYAGKQGVRDGVEGFVFCALSAVSLAVRAWKLRELARERGTL